MKFHFPDSVVFFSENKKIKCSSIHDKVMILVRNQNRRKKHPYFFTSNTDENLDRQKFTKKSYFIAQIRDNMSRILIILLIALLCTIGAAYAAMFDGCKGESILHNTEELNEYFPKETNQTYMVTEHEANGQPKEVHHTLLHLCVCVKSRDGITTGVTDTSNVILLHAPQSDTLVITHVEMFTIKRIYVIHHACSYNYDNSK